MPFSIRSELLACCSMQVCFKFIAKSIWMILIVVNSSVLKTLIAKLVPHTNQIWSYHALFTVFLFLRQSKMYCELRLLLDEDIVLCFLILTRMLLLFISAAGSYCWFHYWQLPCSLVTYEYDPSDRLIDLFPSLFFGAQDYNQKIIISVGMYCRQLWKAIFCQWKWT